MAEYTLPPDLDAFAEACGDAALPAFQGADFNADPSAAFSEGMGAAMDFMIDAGMPPDMCNMIQDICQGGFDQHMASNPDASPMDAFDAVGSAVDMYMADFPADMPCSDCAMDMPPMPPDMGAFMDACPPYGDFPGGESFDPGAMPDAWSPGPMTDMGPGGPAIDPATGMAPQPPEGPGEGGYDDGPAPGDMGPGAMGPDDMPPPMGEGPSGPPPGEGGPPPGDMAGPGDMGPGGPPPGADMDGDGMPPPPPGDMPPPGDTYDATTMAPGAPGGPDPLFGEGGPAGGPPPGDMPPPGDAYDATTMAPGAPGVPDMPPGEVGPDPMGDMHATMDDAGHHHAPGDDYDATTMAPGAPGVPDDVPPPPTDDDTGGDVG